MLTHPPAPLPACPAGRKVKWWAGTKGCVDDALVHLSSLADNADEATAADAAVRRFGQGARLEKDWEKSQGGETGRPTGVSRGRTGPMRDCLSAAPRCCERRLKGPWGRLGPLPWQSGATIWPLSHLPACPYANPPAP